HIGDLDRKEQSSERVDVSFILIKSIAAEIPGIHTDHLSSQCEPPFQKCVDITSGWIIIRENTKIRGITYAEIPNSRRSGLCSPLNHADRSAERQRLDFRHGNGFYKRRGSRGCDHADERADR